MRKPPVEAHTTEQPPYDLNSLESLGCHMFWSEVDEDTSHAACEFIIKSNLIQRNDDPITMIINSVGGECGEGFAVIDLMDTSRIPIATVGTGSIMSMGLLLVSAGTHGMRSLTKNTEIMAHQFSGYFSGKQHELIATQTAYTMLEAKFVKHFQRHSTMNEKQIRDVLFAPSDRYLTPQECKSYGLVDRIVEYFDQPIDERVLKRVRADRSASPQSKRPTAPKPRSKA
jgi:ATP-dependent Clp endopeptidase proteolytic subunit ClpP